MEKTKILILSALLITLIACQAKNVNIKCGACERSACGGNDCYTLTGQNFLQHRCLSPGQQCDATLNTNLIIQDCQYDFNSQICPSKVCFRASNLAIGNYLPDCQTTPQQYKVNCVSGNCQGSDTYCPQSCQTRTQVSNFNSQQNICIAGCFSNQEFSYVKGYCPRSTIQGGENKRYDSIGTFSQCCYTFTNPSGAPFCTSQNVILNSQNLVNWKQGRSFQSYIKFVFALMLIVIFY